MAENLVDVVALALKLGQSPPEHLVTDTDSWLDCPLGHQNPAGFRFCATCGIPMDDTSVTVKVDLEAVRMALSPAVMDDAERDRRDRQHAEAMAANQRMAQEAPNVFAQPDPSQKKLLIHFVADGFTWAGQVWYAGQELEIGPDHPRWATALPWIRLTKAEQVQRWNRVFFDQGPNPFRQQPGQEKLLDTAGVGQWAVMRGGVPAAAAQDGTGSLIPR